MKPTIQRLELSGTMLARGFWLYVWEITIPNGEVAHYVGCTVDKASGCCQSPFDRAAKHLGANRNNKTLRRHAEDRGYDPKRCGFRLHALGPIPLSGKLSHGARCDRVAALEKALADSMRAAEYDVLNQVNCRKPLDEQLWAESRRQFATVFPNLGGPQPRALPGEL